MLLTAVLGLGLELSGLAVCLEITSRINFSSFHVFCGGYNDCVFTSNKEVMLLPLFVCLCPCQQDD